MDRSRAGAARARKPLTGIAVALLLSGAFAVSTGMGHAAESCAGLNAALDDELRFIADQQARPNALAPARIAGRQAVVNLLQQRRAAAGCAGDVGATTPAVPAAPQPPAAR